jgi:aspartate racemase
VRESARRLGDHTHPEITLSLMPMGPTIPWWEAGDLDQINVHLRATAGRLARAGCDFFVCPDNTAHIALEAARETYPLPGLHIAEVVARQAKAERRQRIALLGRVTRWKARSMRRRLRGMGWRCARRGRRIVSC